MRLAVLYPLICVLGLVTAVALLVVSVMVDADPLVAQSTAATETAVRRFYAAINVAIQTGDASALAAAVPPDLVDHAPSPGVAPDRTGLARYLATLHAASPDAELLVEDLVAVGDRALAWVTVRGDDRGAFLGAPPSGTPPLWGAVDALRVADGLVVERWGDADGLVLLEQLGQVAIRAPLPTHQVVALERLLVAPDGRIETRLPDEARLIYLEAGTLTVAVAPHSPGSALLAPVAVGGAEDLPTDIGPGSGVRLLAGDFLALPPLTAYALHNEGAATAAALVVAIHRPGAEAYETVRCDSSTVDLCPSGAADDELAEEEEAAVKVVGQTIAGGRTTVLPPGPVTVSIGRVTMARGAELMAPSAAGPMLLAVEEETLDLETDEGNAWLQHGGMSQSNDLSEGTLGAGDGALLQSGAAATLRNRGEAPTTVLIVTILPTDSGGTSS